MLQVAIFALTMSQDTLRALWRTSAPGRLTPWQQARALAFREASRQIYGGHVAMNWIARFLKKLMMQEQPTLTCRLRNNP